MVGKRLTVASNLTGHWTMQASTPRSATLLAPSDLTARSDLSKLLCPATVSMETLSAILKQ